MNVNRHRSSCSLAAIQRLAAACAGRTKPVGAVPPSGQAIFVSASSSAARQSKISDRIPRGLWHSKTSGNEPVPEHSVWPPWNRPVSSPRRRTCWFHHHHQECSPVTTNNGGSPTCTCFHHGLGIVVVGVADNQARGPKGASSARLLPHILNVEAGEAASDGDDVATAADATAGLRVRPPPFSGRRAARKS